MFELDYQGEPFVLFVGKGFIDAAQKSLHKKFNIFNLLLEVNEKFTKLNRKEVKQWLEKATGSKSILKTQKGTTAIRILLNLTVMVMALLVMATAFMHMSNPVLLLLTAFLALLNLAMQREIVSRPSAADIGDSIIIEYQSVIQRFRNPPIYFWVVIPKTSEGAERAKKVFKAIRDRVGVTPIAEWEWFESKQIRELFAELKLNGIKENFWQNI